MKLLYKLLALSGLLLTVAPPYLHYTGTLTEAGMKSWVLAGTVIWFIGAIPWLGKKEADDRVSI